MTVVTDNFDRANEAPLASPWISLANVTTPFDLVDSQVRPRDFGWDCEAGWDAAVNAIGANQFSEAKLYVTGTSGSGSGLGLLLRSNNVPLTGRNLYRFVTDHKATDNIEFSKRVNGTYTHLGYQTASWTDGDLFRVEIDGSTLTVKFAGNVVGTYTDTSHDSGQPGIGFSSAETSAFIDDWSGGDLEALPLDKILPDADIVTTGWTTTPLYSKVNDSSDATVIQATASES